jgi:MGT family glycosyltransferase
MVMIETEDIRTMSAPQDKKRFLFAHWEGGGNTPPTLAIVRRLTARGHSVHVVSDPCNRDEFEGVGATFASWRRPPVRVDRTAASDPLRDWEVKSPLALLARLRDRILVGPALLYARDLLDEFARQPTDAVVVNDMMLGAMMAGERTSVPTIGLSANICLYPLPGVPPFGPGFLPATGIAERIRDKAVAGVTRMVFGKTTAAYNQARAALGLAAIAHPLDQVKRLDRLLILTSPAFDFPAHRLPENIVYTGPELADPAWLNGWSDPRTTRDDRPLVLVGFSTTFQDQAATLQRVIQALATLPVTAIVTAGPAMNPAAFTPPPNVQICAGAPHSVLLKEASVAVTHAGHGTVIRSLAAGVPLLCMPMGRDQNDNAARVFAHGAGLRLSPSAPVEAIRQSLTDLLKVPRFRERAQQLGRQIVKDAADSRTVAILEEQAGALDLGRVETRLRAKLPAPQRG